MTNALAVVIVSGVILIAEIILLGTERRYSRRIFLVQTRSAADKIFSKTARTLGGVKLWFVHVVVKMTWHKTAYSVLKSFAAILKTMYAIVEANMHLKQKHISTLRQKSNKSQKLQEMKTHKDAVSLTEAEKKKLRRTSIE